ncbi:MAG: diacylglycerol kinase [Holosporales bacterium]|jgi:diacylglycerol kinase (ATP)|nr:diacylglycerol kinase [Holosporales bacterium]
MQRNMKKICDVLAIKSALLYSLNGLKYLLKERAFCQELLGGIALVIAELFRDTPIFMLVYIYFSYFLILFAESINSGIEAAVDRIGLEKHELSKKAKDIGSAIVFLAIMHFCIVWIASFFI